MPDQVSPMLACLADSVPAGEGWLYEIKWDGVRALCFIEDGELRIYSRNQKRSDAQYPELTVLPDRFRCTSAILDGEIAALDEKGRPVFNRIQPRISVGDPNTIAHLSRSNPVTLYLFDLLYLDGYDLRGAALTDRKRLLEERLTTTERIRYSNHFTAGGDQMLEAARQNGLEGIIAKRADSKYEGRRSSNWLKIKVVQDREFVIGGFTHGEREYFSSLVLGAYRNGKLVHTGQVGTGFDERKLADIYAKLKPLITNKSPFSGAITNRLGRKVTWVKPELVAKIKFLEFTPDGILRAPVFVALRDDVDARDVRLNGDGDEQGGDVVAAGSKAEQSVIVDGRALKFTNLSKVFYPDDGTTKRDVINYYNAVAGLILPHLRDRPLSLKRYPNGIAEDFFFQKDVEQAPDWVRIEPVFSESNQAPIRFVVANDRATLLWLANLACIDQNPWMSRVGTLDNPDFVLIDLDPQDAPFDLVVEAALLVREKLDQVGLAGYPKTTGGDGMHIYVPLEPVYTYEQVRRFAEILAILVINERPRLFTTPRAVAKRTKGKVYFDYLQIAAGKTIAAPYVLRAYPAAPVSTPLEWSEVRPGLHPSQFNIHNVRERFAQKGDLFAPVLARRQRLEDALQRLGAGLKKGS